MRNGLTLTLLLACCASFVAAGVHAQDRAVWVYFTDKGPEAGTLLEAGSAAQLGLTDAAIERRARMAGIDLASSSSVDDMLGRVRFAAMNKRWCCSKP